MDEQRTVTFSCTAKAEDIKWIINGSQLESSAYDSAIDLRRIPSDVLFYSSVTFPPVSQQYHSTRVRCQAMHQQNIVESPDAYLTITGDFRLLATATVYDHQQCIYSLLGVDFLLTQFLFVLSDPSSNYSKHYFM